MLYLLVDTAILTEFFRLIFKNFRPFQITFRQNRFPFYYTYVYLCYIACQRKFYQNFWIF